MNPLQFQVVTLENLHFPRSHTLKLHNYILFIQHRADGEDKKAKGSHETVWCLL